jgi:hypothetical protein
MLMSAASRPHEMQPCSLDRGWSGTEPRLPATTNPAHSAWTDRPSAGAGGHPATEDLTQTSPPAPSVVRIFMTSYSHNTACVRFEALGTYHLCFLLSQPFMVRLTPSVLLTIPELYCIEKPPPTPTVATDDMVVLCMVVIGLFTT